MHTFVQLGATRDGLDPYLAAARMRGMKAILIETPDYLQWRRTLGRQEFDHTIAVEHPANADEVLSALAHHALRPTMLLAGFERYIAAAYTVARHLDILPCRPGDAFLPLHKAEQRKALTEKQVPVYQPDYAVLPDLTRFHPELLKFSYPYVIKPVDGGGGLGVFLVANDLERAQVLTTLRTLTNYDGGAFQGMIIEQYIAGTEYSVQGVVQDDQVRCLAVCKKYIGIEKTASSHAAHGFRELGHIASDGAFADPALKQCVQACVDAFRYQNGPFHVDLIQASQGFAFLEMGFRLSGGGLVRLIERASGYNWAEEVFRLHLHETAASQTAPRRSVVVGQISVRSAAEIEAAQRLQQQGYAVEIERFSLPKAVPAASSLTSDLSRHTSFIGRVIVSALTLDEVQQLLTCCLSQQSVFADGAVHTELAERGKNG